MNVKNTIPKQRIDIIDALRGFALIGILFVHCLEHFDATRSSVETNEIIKWLDNAVKDIIRFLFLGKAYGIFAMLFGLSFFIQMENSADKGVDFRLRYIWRLLLLYIIGHLNGLFYSGEILVVYALFGLILIPLYKLPVRYIFILCIIFLFLIPDVIRLAYLFTNPEAKDFAFFGQSSTGNRFRAMSKILSTGTFTDVMTLNLWEGQAIKWMYYLQPVNIFRISGLFMVGLLLGKLGIHKDEVLLVKYAKKGFLWGLVLFTLFFCLNKMMPLFTIENLSALKSAKKISQMYANLGLMFMITGVFTLSYFRLDAKNILNKLAPMGRISLTNYIMQSFAGAFIFYGFGLGLAPCCGPVLSLLIALIFAAFQIWFSSLWIKSYYYGPVEWLWRLCTWLPSKKVPFKRL